MPMYVADTGRIYQRHKHRNEYNIEFAASENKLIMLYKHIFLDRIVIYKKPIAYVYSNAHYDTSNTYYCSDIMHFIMTTLYHPSYYVLLSDKDRYPSYKITKKKHPRQAERRRRKRNEIKN